MAGSIRKRGKDSWELRIELGRDPVTGKRKFRYQSLHGNKREAEQALTDALHRRDTGNDVAPTKITVSEYLERWLRDYAKVNVAPSTYHRYEQIVDRLRPLIGSRRLQDLKPAHIQAAYGSLLGEGLAARTVLHHHRVLREALHQAMRWQFMTHNPADAVTPPRPARTEMRALDATEVHALLDGCADDQMRTIIYTAVTTGMRLGELLGLRWSDVDLEGGTVHLVRAAQYMPETGVTFRTPKTSRSRRSIALSEESVRVLRTHRKQQIERRLSLGEGYADGDLVFATIDGQPEPPYRVSQTFRRLVQRLKLGPLRFHDLRHTAATLMLRGGVHPKIVSDRLGHSTIAITLDTYSHVLPDMQRDAAAALARVLAR